MNRFIHKKISIWLVLTTLLLVNNIYGQNPDIVQGYYQSAQGDSLSGQLYLGDLKHNVLKFRREKNSRWIVLSPKDVQKAVVETGVQIFPQVLRTAETDEQIFVKTLVIGNYTLLKGYTTKGDALFFVGLPRNNSLVKINPFGLEPQLRLLLDSCGRRENVKIPHYNSASLTKYFKETNQCAFPNEKTLTFGQKLKPRFGIGLSAFYYNINPSVSDKVYFTGNYYRVDRISGGISARLIILPLLTIHAGLNYVDKRITSDTVEMRLKYTREVPGVTPFSTSNYYRYASDLNFKYLEVPIGVTFQVLPFAKNSPTISCGIAMQMPIKSRIESDWGYPFCPTGFCDLPSGEIGHISPIGVKVDKGSLSNFFGGFGFRSTLKNQHELEVRIDYFSQLERATVRTNKIFPQNLPLPMKTHRWQLSFNYYLYFKNRTK